jgi:hypothetical protein
VWVDCGIAHQAKTGSWRREAKPRVDHQIVALVGVKVRDTKDLLADHRGWTEDSVIHPKGHNLTGPPD